MGAEGQEHPARGGKEGPTRFDGLDPESRRAYREAEEQLRRLARAPSSAPSENQPRASLATGEGEGLSPSEWELRKAEARFRTLVEQIPAVTFMAALDEGLNELYVSPQIEAMLGFTQKEWLEDPILWYRQLHPDDKERWNREFAQTCATGARFRSQYRFLSRAGDVVWVHGEAVLVRDDAGRPLFLQGVAFDITDRRRAEEERIAQIRAEAARAEAEAANRAKDHFLAVLSHELRNPLNPVLLATSAALDDPATPSGVLPLLAMIRRNVQIEARLIDDLLDVNRIMQGKLGLSPERLDGHILIQQALEICGKDVGAGGLDVALELSAREPHVEADPVRLPQILWNLIKNAVKFTPPGGRITIRSRNEPAEGGGRDRLIVEVVDTGIGIAPEALSRIFSPFEQADATISRRYGGMGLGLAIGRSLAEMHGGRLSVASDGLGRGATFSLELATAPALTAEPCVASPAPQAISPPSTLRILLVEDNADALRIMARLIRGCGHRVTTAGGVGEALGAAAIEDFDLVISDLGLPDGTGLDLMRQLRGRGAIRGIALSGFGMEDDLAKSREAGFETHLTKPVDFPNLEAMIRQVATAIARRPPGPD